MNYFVKGFQQLGLSTSTPIDYKSAEDFARQLKRFSALEEHEIHYSPGTAPGNEAIAAAIQNQFTSK